MMAHFKTQATYGVQPISGSDPTIRLMDLYRKYMRPEAAMRTKDGSNKFFVSYDGKDIKKPGNLLIYYTHTHQYPTNTITINTNTNVVATISHLYYIFTTQGCI